jgi:hypothetical protein
MYEQSIFKQFFFQTCTMARGSRERSTRSAVASNSSHFPLDMRLRSVARKVSMTSLTLPKVLFVSQRTTGPQYGPLQEESDALSAHNTATSIQRCAALIPKLTIEGHMSACMCNPSQAIVLSLHVSQFNNVLNLLGASSSVFFLFDGHRILIPSSKLLKG